MPNQQENESRILQSRMKMMLSVLEDVKHGKLDLFPDWAELKNYRFASARYGMGLLTLSGVVAYLCIEGSMMYFRTGCKGAQYLPLDILHSRLAKKISGDDAFGINFLFNVYICADTAAWLCKEAKLKNLMKNHQLTYPTKKENILRGISIAYACLCALTFFDVAEQYDDTVIIKISTFITNALAHFLGAYYFLDFPSEKVIKGYDWFKNLTWKQIMGGLNNVLDLNWYKNNCVYAFNGIKNWFCKSGYSKDQPSLSFNEYVGNELTKKIRSLELNLDSNTIELENLFFLLNQDYSTYKDIYVDSNPGGKKQILSTVGKIGIHALNQISNLVSCWGFYGLTVDEFMKLGNNSTEDNIVIKVGGSLFFIPFLVLYIKFTHDTTKEMISLVEKVRNFYVDWRNGTAKLDFKKDILMGSAIGLWVIFSYVASFIAAGTSLELNAKHDLDYEWSRIMTSYGNSVSTGYAVSMIFVQTSMFLYERFANDQEKRQSLKDSRNLNLLWSRVGAEIEKIAAEQGNSPHKS